jgi:septal ring-binding cell division protein DamX
METNSPQPFDSQKIRRTASVADLTPQRNRGLLSGSPSAFHKPIINFDNFRSQQGQTASGHPPVTTTVPGLTPNTLIYSQSSASTGGLHNNNSNHYHVRYSSNSMYSCRLSIYYRFLHLSHRVIAL